MIPWRRSPLLWATRDGGIKMQESLQRLAREVAGYGVGLGLTRALGVIVALIYPIVLSQSDYGNIDVVTSLLPVLSPLLLLGMDVGLGRLYYQRPDQSWRHRLTATAFYAIIGITVPVTGLLMVFSAPLALALYADDVNYILYLRLSFLSLPFTVFNGFQLLVLRLERRLTAFNVLTIANQVIGAAVAVPLIVFAHLGAVGALIGLAAAQATTSTAGLLLNWRFLCHRPVADKLREMLRMGLPLSVAGVPLWVLQSSDRLFLVRIMPGDPLGLYAMANGIVAMLGMVFYAFQFAWNPFAFSIMDQERSPDIYARTLTMLTASGATLAAGTALFATEGLTIINWLTGKDWRPSLPALGPLVLGMLFYAMFLVTQAGIYITKRTSAIVWTLSLAAAGNLLLNAVLIPPLGIMGAAIATALSYFTALVTMYVKAQRLAYIPYEARKVAATVLACVAVVALAIPLNTRMGWGTELLKVALLLLFGLGLLAARVVTVAELRALGDGVLRGVHRARSGRADR